MTGSWNLANATLTNGVVTGTASSSWQALASGSGPINVGFIASSSSGFPSFVSVNSVQCTITNPIAPHTSCPGSNLIVDGGFETCSGFPSANNASVSGCPSWRIDYGNAGSNSFLGVWSGYGHNSNNALGLGLIGGGTAVNGLQQTVATNIGSVYQLSFWLKGSGLPNKLLTAVAGGITILQLINVNLGSYVQFTATFTATSTTTIIEILGDNNPSYLFVDDVSLVQCSSCSVNVVYSGQGWSSSYPLLVPSFISNIAPGSPIGSPGTISKASDVSITSGFMSGSWINYGVPIQGSAVVFNQAPCGPPNATSACYIFVANDGGFTKMVLTVVSLNSSGQAWILAKTARYVYPQASTPFTSDLVASLWSSAGATTVQIALCQTCPQYGVLNVSIAFPAPTNSVNLFLTNTGSLTFPYPYTFSLSRPSFLGPDGGHWNYNQPAYSAGTFSGLVNVGTWAALGVGSSAANIGLILGAADGNFTPTAFSVSGTGCTVTTTIN